MKTSTKTAPGLSPDRNLRKEEKEKRKREKENKNEKAQPDYKKKTKQYTTLPPSPFPLHPPLFPLRRQNRLFGENLIW